MPPLSLRCSLSLNDECGGPGIRGLGSRMRLDLRHNSVCIQVLDSFAFHPCHYEVCWLGQMVMRENYAKR